MEPANPPQLVGYRTSRGTFIDLVVPVPWGFDKKIMVAARPRDGKGLVERRVAVDHTTTLIYYVVETDLINVVIDFPEQVARWTAHDWDQWFKLNQKRTANAGETAAENVHAVGDLPTEGFKYATSQEMQPIAAAAVASGELVVMMGPQPKVIPRGLPSIGSGQKSVAGQMHDLTDSLPTGMSGPAPKQAAPKGISKIPDETFTPNPSVKEPYRRPRGAGPTAAQRAAVQGKPCVECGKVTPKQVADHIDPLSVQHYRDGAVDIAGQTKVEAVQPHCPDCSLRQGGLLSAFSKRMKSLLGW
jgi:hypothetical protein